MQSNITGNFLHELKLHVVVHVLSWIYKQYTAYVPKNKAYKSYMIEIYERFTFYYKNFINEIGSLSQY